MKYTIIGSGPSGLSLAYVLSLNNIKIDLIEQDKQLGGSWNAQWVDDKYFSENSPRVFSNSGNSKILLTHLGFTNKDFHNIYGNFFETNYKILSFIFKHFNIIDYFIFLFAAIKYRFISENITVRDWINTSGLSKKARKAVKIISILICDRPDKTNINDFFGSVSYALPTQMKEPNKWHDIIEKKLKQNKNVTILKNTQVINLEKQDSLFHVYTKNKEFGYITKRFADKVFMCTQSSGIYSIIKNSRLRNNWMPVNEMKRWSENTFYSGFGFQLHFDRDIEFKNEWCWSCTGDWTVIILPVSNWLKEYSKDNSIKAVWSCCVVDMDSRSKRIGKTANQCDRDEVINECLSQIGDLHTIEYPKLITFSEGLKKINGRWVSKNTGYTKNTYNDLNMRGKESNLFALGCFTKTSKNNIAYMGGAIDAVAEYISKYETIHNNIFKL